MAMEARITASVPTPEPLLSLVKVCPKEKELEKSQKKNASLVHNSINIKCQHNWEGVSRQSLFSKLVYNCILTND